MYTGRYEVVARTSGVDLVSIGVSDLEETVLVEVVAGNLRYAVAQHQVLLHGRTAQVKVAVLQTDLVTDLLGVVNLKRGGLRLGQNADVLGNISTSPVGIFLLMSRVAATSLPFTATTNSVRQVKAMSNRSALTDLSNVHCHNARTVAQQQEQNAAVVTHAVNPAVYGNGLTGAPGEARRTIGVRFSLQ